MSELLTQINNNSARKKESSHIEKALKSQIAEREKLVSMITDLYPDWKSGVITVDEYQMLKERLNERLRIADEKIASLNKSAEQFQDAYSQVVEYIELNKQTYRTRKAHKKEKIGVMIKRVSFWHTLYYMFGIITLEICYQI